MERKQILIGIFILIFLGLFGSFIFSAIAQDRNAPIEFITKIREAENSLAQTQNLAGYLARYQNAQLEYYYQYDNCLAAAKSALVKLDGRIWTKAEDRESSLDEDVARQYGIDENAKMPIAILKGKAQIYDYGGNHLRDQELVSVFSGIGACSEKILLNNLCGLLKNQSGICEQILGDENTESALISADDAACYTPCNIKYSVGDALFSQIWQGPPCERIEGYSQDRKVVYRKCSEQNCLSLEEDSGCCLENECVLKGKCVSQGTSRDIDEDGDYEICAEIENEGVWIDPDSSSNRCLSGKFLWFSCENYEQCKFGINNYKKGQTGLCCGDDPKEFATRCKGRFCGSDSDYSCCKDSQCTFNGKCYDAGCASLDMKGRTISAYCDGPSKAWVDLDDDFCSLCLGNGASSGDVCCGDDVDEGKDPIPFIYTAQNGTTIKTALFGCVKTGSQCVYPFSEAPFNEGYYLFKEDSPYLEGSYFCSNEKWYSLDSNSRFCKKSGYNWDSSNKLCCGDSPNEFWIKGVDNSYGCCSSQGDTVISGQCQQNKVCGNNIIDASEACERPDTQDSGYCEQASTLCQDTKTAVRDSRGYCNRQCQCQEDPLKYTCRKNSCGAQCGSDSDCAHGYGCDQSSCSCKFRTFCGDGTIQKLNDFSQKEECDPPSTINSTFCKIEECKDKKSKKSLAVFSIEAEGYGNCKNNCKCDYKGFNYTCTRGKCAAECNEDGTGCREGMACNKDSCSCYSLYVCGNGVCEENEQDSCEQDCTIKECPVKIDIETESAVYYQNDTISASIIAYDEANKPLPDVLFDFDLVVNDVLIGSSTYSTSSSGTYVIKKKISSSAPRGTHNYIVKTKVQACPVVSDTEYVTIFVNNPYTIPPSDANYSRFEFILDAFNFTRQQIPQAKCGDGVVGYGEACEGSGICRQSFGCNYQARIFDQAESCSECSCPEDVKSPSGGGQYCDSCKHCGDFEVNCNEDCENGTVNRGTVCRSNRMYQKNDVCRSCKWEDDGIISDLLLDTCECKCPKNPEENCAGGNYVNYTRDYVAGCEGGKCRQCSCQDTYTKDSNKDGIEDKCAQEYCGNKIDDNDNGKTDEAGCIWYYCSQCGYGLFKSCTKEDCARYEQKCFFSETSSKFLWMNRSSGLCNKCSDIRGCEGYMTDSATCQLDPCSFSSCSWTGQKCCVDADGDKICNREDNCINATNFDQPDSDKDGLGDACDLCPWESNLTKPNSTMETECQDGVDNDCDGKIDCLDMDCSGTGVCCQSASDCRQSSCIIESCTLGKCVYERRPVCDSTECKTGMCDLEGACSDVDSSPSACINCAQDKTPQDYGIGYNLSIFSKQGCCGDSSNEYYVRSNNSTACCDSLSDCSDNGVCRNSGTAFGSSYCMDGKILSCSRESLCAEAGSSFLPYLPAKESGMFCVFDGLKYSFSSRYPKEACSDLADNDCDKKTDSEDEDC